ncbi:phosphoribosyl-ATP diphosphatase [Oscillospiraceae bacterium OttesenSCG-928-G22]|nr:phosphoribosyl-ATP diphosphatase [Oscillospiraceae bacterium OttesenSCG-928-G22]
MTDAFESLYKTILERKENPEEGSYTAYLFEKGKDKILKKIAEEAGETIIAAKNGDNLELTLELSDLLYHLLVLMADSGVTPGDITAELETRSKKSGNLKPQKTVDKNT